MSLQEALRGAPPTTKSSRPQPAPRGAQSNQITTAEKPTLDDPGNGGSSTSAPVRAHCTIYYQNFSVRNSDIQTTLNRQARRRKNSDV
eukprot:scaffold148933_cov22-Prasinocladus_malaysianus.AAC.1